MNEIYKNFINPPREYAIYPIIHDGMKHYLNVINYHLDCGFAGVVANISYNEHFPNDTSEWIDFEKGCRAYFDSNMKVWIYDEKGYPSGTAGGAALDSHPEYEGLELMCFSYWKTLTGTGMYRADTPSGKLYKAMLVPLEGGEAVDITETVNENGTLHFNIPNGAFKLLILTQRRLFDATHAAHSYSEPRRYVDLFNPDATRCFMNLTHERYKAILSDEFGKGVKAFFTDEPSLIGWNIPDASYPLLTWSKRLPELFNKRYGYDIEKAVIAVFLGAGSQYMKRRCDFWDFTADMLAESFFGEIQRWCHENNTRSSGHLLCEENLLEHVSCYGSYYRTAKKLDYPGIDQLESEPSNLMNKNSIPIARLAASFADVYNLKETFSEASDHTSRHHNRQIPIEWIRASMNWHMAQGINNVTSYYSFDYFTKEQLVDLNQYTARLGTILRLGERFSRVAVLYPENAMWAAFQPTSKSHNQGQSELANRIQQIFAAVSWELLNRQIDYDYIDEIELVIGKIGQGQLHVLTRKYECLILPLMYVMKRESISQVCKFLRSGGKVIAVGMLPEICRETGEAADYMDQLLPFLSKGNGLTLVPDDGFAKAANVLPRTIRLLPVNINSLLTGFSGEIENMENEIISSNILSHIRKYGDKLIVFLCNMGAAYYNGKLIVYGYSHVEEGNPKTGEFSEIKSQMQGDQLSYEVNLKAYDGMVYILK